MNKEELNLDYQKAYEVFKDTMREGDYLLAVKSALSKQIPKKPIKIGEDYISERREWVYDYECPSCGNPYADDSYCSCCGQKLDWGDGE